MSTAIQSPRWTATAAAPSAAGAGQGWSGGSFGLERWWRLASDTARLPFRVLGLGLELLGRAGRQARRATDIGVADAVSQYLPAGPLAASAPWAVRSSLTPTYPSLQRPPAAVSPQGPQAPSSSVQVPPPGDGGGLAAKFAETPTRKEKPMACDNDLSGSDLKIIQYSIVTVDPYLDDCVEEDEKGNEIGPNRRVLFGPSTISTTQDMTEADFTAWVVAINFQREEARRIRHCEKQYLRVCYSVQCRLPVPDANYPQRQVEVLERIARKLPGPDRHEVATREGGPPAKSR